MNLRGTSVGEQKETTKKIDFLKKTYIPLLNEMLNRLDYKIQQLKPDEIKGLLEYKTDLEKTRSILQVSLRGHCRHSMDYMNRWEKRLVGYMNDPNLMAAFQLPGDQLPQLQIPQLKQYDRNHSNTPIDQKSMLTPLPKTGTPLRFANLPHYTPSSCTPLASSDLPGIPEYQQNVVPTSLPKDGNIGQTLVSSLLQQGQAIHNITPVISNSLSSEKCAYLECNLGGGTAAMIKPDKSVSTITPLERVLKAVNTSSSKSLSAAANDICSVVSMTDVFAGSHPGQGGYRSYFPEDLVSTTRCRVEHRNFEVINNVVGKKLKRCYSIESSLSALPLDYKENNGCKKLNGFESSEELKSAATSGIKKSRPEMNCALLEEVREINHMLINTKLDISEEGSSLMSAEETIVNCTFSPITRSSTRKFPALPMWFLIPANYPLCSPVLYSSHVSQSDDDCTYEAVLTYATIKFYASISCMSEPISLKEMAKCWDSCANQSFLSMPEGWIIT